ncbi:unnamed protein product [Amoebophrya sp. A120]|nr:unnamed protein product [Amoebophrya sp. A120]|eukprot:GSA120T00003423001.1
MGDSAAAERILTMDEFVHANCSQFKQVPPDIFKDQMSPSVIEAVTEVIGALGGEIPTGAEGITEIEDPYKKVQALNAFLFQLISNNKPVVTEEEYNVKREQFPDKLPPFGQLYEAARNPDLPISSEEDD